jgi:putative ABC transport system ATP-binding protein
MTVVVITHNAALTAMADKVIRMKNGQVSEVTCNNDPLPVEAIEW